MNRGNRLLLGAISGIVATGPMTAAMILWHRRLPLRERYPLPPREITMKLADKAHLSAHMSGNTRSAATILSHFAYGATCGALYTAVTRPTSAPVTKGALFGLFVWIASYLGWLPAAGILSPATQHPERRNALMIVSHLIWGLSLSGMAALLGGEMDDETMSPFSGNVAPDRDRQPVFP